MLIKYRCNLCNTPFPVSSIVGRGQGGPLTRFQNTTLEFHHIDICNSCMMIVDNRREPKSSKITKIALYVLKRWG